VGILERGKVVSFGSYWGLRNKFRYWACVLAR